MGLSVAEMSTPLSEGTVTEHKVRVVVDCDHAITAEGKPYRFEEPSIGAAQRVIAAIERGHGSALGTCQGTHRILVTGQPRWECKGANAWTWCLYDDDTDPTHDTCVVCGHPEERL